MCSRPMCTNIAVNSLHHSLLSSCGPKLAPHFSSSSDVGSMGDTPLAAMATKTRTLIAMSTMVMFTRG